MTEGGACEGDRGHARLIAGPIALLFAPAMMCRRRGRLVSPTVATLPIPPRSAAIVHVVAIAVEGPPGRRREVPPCCGALDAKDWTSATHRPPRPSWPATGSAPHTAAPSTPLTHPVARMPMEDFPPPLCYNDQPALASLAYVRQTPPVVHCGAPFSPNGAFPMGEPARQTPIHPRIGKTSVRPWFRQANENTTPSIPTPRACRLLLLLAIARLAFAEGPEACRASCRQAGRRTAGLHAARRGERQSPRHRSLAERRLRFR